MWGRCASFVGRLHPDLRADMLYPCPLERIILFAINKYSEREIYQYK